MGLAQPLTLGQHFLEHNLKLLDLFEGLLYSGLPGNLVYREFNKLCFTKLGEMLIRGLWKLRMQLLMVITDLLQLALSFTWLKYLCIWTTASERTVREAVVPD